MTKQENLFYDAVALYKQNKFEEAVKTLHQIEQLGFFSPMALDLKAKCLLTLENYEEAFIAANKALKYEEHSTLYGHRGLALHKLGLIEEALKDYEKGAELGDEACKNNIEAALYDSVLQAGEAFERAKRGDVSTDLNNFFFISTVHDRFENGRLIQKNPNSNRAIRVKSNISGGSNFTVIIYNLDEMHPAWKSYTQMAPKQMKVISSNSYSVELIGYGTDRSGEPFSNYGLIINERDKSVTSKIYDRNIELLYHK
ncbi:MAG TPA: CDC27 family protein [Hanamia sp.]